MVDRELLKEHVRAEYLDQSQPLGFQHYDIMETIAMLKMKGMTDYQIERELGNKLGPLAIRDIRRFL